MSTIQSKHFKNIFLRMDGQSVNQYNNFGSGIVNCQFGAFAWEQFNFESQGNGTYVIRSVHYSKAILRMEGECINEFNISGCGTVNCQFSIEGEKIKSYEKFYIEKHRNFYTIRSKQFPNIYLRMDARRMSKFCTFGGGIVNTQYIPSGKNIGAYEKFLISDFK